MLIDASGLLCLLHRAEPFHSHACTAYQAAARRVTHNYILAEFVALAQARGLPRTEVLGFLDDLVHNPDITLHWVDQARHNAALSLLAARLDKSYSLCDAVSFVLMRRLNLSTALSTDRHFEQEGLQRLLV